MQEFLCRPLQTFNFHLMNIDVLSGTVNAAQIFCCNLKTTNPAVNQENINTISVSPVP